MMLSVRAARSAVLALAAAVWPAITGGAQAAGGPSVVELFTSQGCSSCPPADELLAVLAKNPSFIALSLPVDYWDYLGWKDTYAKHAFTERQQAYSADRGDRQVYTPQAVINGRQHANGASRGEIDRAIAATQSGLDVPVRLERKAGAVTVTIGAGGTGKGAVVVAMPVIGQREVAIGRGENARRKVVYTNIVREVVSLGDWRGSETAITLPAGAIADAESVVVLVQAGTLTRPGAILGAAQIAVK